MFFRRDDFGAFSFWANGEEKVGKVSGEIVEKGGRGEGIGGVLSDELSVVYSQALKREAVVSFIKGVVKKEAEQSVRREGKKNKRSFEEWRIHGFFHMVHKAGDGLFVENTIFYIDLAFKRATKISNIVQATDKGFFS